MANKKITIEATIHAPIGRVWELWTKPEHIMKWNNASEDWHTPAATNDVREGGKFDFRMEAKDGTAGFDFEGVYDEVATEDWLAYTISDGRKVEVSFEDEGDGDTHITETFEIENENSEEMQRQGWQAILDSFKGYAEGAFNGSKS
ncbi:MAG: SRPBCC domain-containing protein [Candidatus Taylorbacteria bacterium]|nr:SRPBCC domain-containing protein [Candidatus Taylorbacteria bacterium]